MKLNLKLWAMTAVALFAMNSCTQEEEIITGEEQKGTPVNFEFGIGAVTKTAMNDSYETSFIADDAVGIFQVDPNTNVVLASGKYVYDGTNWNVEEGTTAITAVEGEEYFYYAYYPYKEEVTTYTNVSITVALSQVAGIEANDALMANCRTSSSQVELGFKHAFALVQVNLSGTMAADDAIVTLKNIYPQCTLNLTDFIVGDAAGEASDIVMWQHATDKGVYRAIVPAQTITATNALLDVSSNGKNYRFTWDADVEYESGNLRVINVTLGETPQEIAISIPASDTTIDTWGNSEPTPGSGDYEESFDYVETVELQFTDGITFTDVAGNWSSAPIDFRPTEITWYHREPTTGALTTPTIENNSLKLAVTARGSWNGSHVTCHYPGHFENDAVYQVDYTWSMGESTTAGIIGIAVSNSDDSKRFLMRNKLDNSNTWNRNLTTNNSTVNALSFYLDFSQASTEGRADLSEYQETISTTTAEEVSNGINITFYNYTADANNPSEVILNSFKITKLGKVSEIITE